MAFTIQGRDANNGTLALEDSRALLAKKTELERIFDDLRIKASNGIVDPDALASGLEAAQACLPIISEVVPKQHKSLLYPELNNTSGLAEKVFNITELMEMILGHLTISELLAAQCVNRTLRDTVEKSPTLQRNLMQVASKSDDFFTPFEDVLFPHFELRNNTLPTIKTSEKRQPDEKNAAYITANFSSAKDLRLGTRCRNMLLVRPPITAMTANLNCCHEPYESDEPREKGILIIEPTGITVGDLLDTAALLKYEHWFCGNALARHLDENDGHVHIKVTFQARIVLRPDDPMLKARRQREDGLFAGFDQHKEIQDMLQEYVDARNASLRSGEAPQEFTEWRKTYVRAEEVDDTEDLPQ